MPSGTSKIVRDRRGQRPTRSDGRQLLAHEEGDRERKARRGYSGKRGDERNGSFVAVLGAGTTRQAATPDFERT